MFEKKLENLNLKDVAAKTQIELDFLEALVNKDFSRLSRFNVKGFLKILSREYELDFSELLEEYELYKNQNNEEANSKLVTPKLDSYTSKSGSNLFFLASIGFIVVLVLFLYYFDSIKSLFKHEENNISNNSIIEIIDKAKNNLKSLNSTSSNLAIIDNDEHLSSISDTNNTNENNQSLSENNITENLQNLNENNASKEAKQAIFKINNKIWIGIINLKDYKKTSLVKDQDFNISLEDNLLILTGATALSLIDQDNKETKYPAGSSKRFLVENGTIKPISTFEFNQKNKGKGW